MDATNSGARWSFRALEHDAVEVLRAVDAQRNATQPLTNLALLCHAGAVGIARCADACGSPIVSPSSVGRKHVGQRGSQWTIAAAMAMRIVASESSKWRSGRRADRVGLIRPSGRGGKSADALGNEEGVTA